MWALFSLQLLWLGPGILCQETDYPDCSWNILNHSGQWKSCESETRCRCLTEIVNTTEETIVSCRESKLAKVPTHLPNTTVFLDLSANNIKSLSVQKFTRYPNLVNLTISQNELTEIKIGAFEGLSNLQCLSLRNNSIRYNSVGFKPGVFAPLENLKLLNIQQNFSGNDYTNESYELNALNDLRFLEQLFLDGIPEQNLGEVFKNLTSLQELIFNGRWGRCLLPKLTPNFFPDGTSLTHITVFGCSLDEIEAKSFKALTHLQFLDLSHNENLTFQSLSNITDGLQFTNITTFKLNKVHETFGPCVMLTEKNLNGLKNLTLKELYLDSNRITGFETNSIDNIPLTLETISVKDNSFMFDHYIIGILKRISKAAIKRVVVSDQFSNHDYTELKTGLNLVHTSGSRQTNDEDYYRLASKRHLRTNRKRNVHETLGGKHSKPKPIKKVNKNGKEFGLITVDMKEQTRKSINSNVQHQLISPENKNENKIDKPWKEDSYGKPFIVILPETLSYVDASNSKIKRIVNEVYSVNPNNLKEVNLSRNLYWEWHGPILGFENLTKLDMSWNSCNRMNLSFFEHMPNLLYLDISRNYLDISINEDKNGTIFHNQRKLEILDISQNMLTTLPDNVFIGLKNLTQLYLAWNRFIEFRVNLSQMSLLKKLELNNNQLGTIEEPLRLFFDRQAKVANFSLNLENNNFKCDCANMDFLLWISESKVNFENKHNYWCHFSDERDRVGNLSEAINIYHELEKKCYIVNYVSLIAVCTAAIVLVSSLTGAAIVYRYRWNLRYMYYMAKYKAGRVTERPRGYQPVAAEENEIRDVNVSYADEDSSFVRQKLFKELEKKRGLKLYIRDRNAPVDERYICDNILDAIEGTRKTLIIMSEAYVQHKWCIFEMHMAGIKALKTDSNRLCVLMLEPVANRDLPLKIMKIIKDGEFLEYPGDANVQDLFWDNLKDRCTDI